MQAENKQIGVVVLEPNSDLLKKLCLTAMSIWGVSEVLPRQTGKQLRVAANHLEIGLVIVRASVQRSCPIIQSVLLDLVARGAQIIIVQETAHPFSVVKPVSIGKMHFFYNGLSEDVFKELLTRCLVNHVMPTHN